jgi:glutamate dehydrogenase
MSGDVFGNGMLLSKAIKLVAAFDHRHIFIDPDPDPAKSWAERKRLFDLPRSSWDDYDRKLMSKGGGDLPAQPEVDRAHRRGARALGIEATRRSIPPPDQRDPQGAGRPALVRRHRHLHQGVDQSHAEVGDPANDALRVDAASFAPRSSARAPTSPSPRPGGSSSPSAAGASTPTSSTIAPASIARTMRSTSRSRSTARCARGG